MSYICSGCGRETAYGLLVCQNCQRWAQHVEQLTRERDRLRALLRPCEWTGFPVGLRVSHPHFSSVCPCCQRPQKRGHAPDCEMEAALEGRDV